MKKIVAFLAAAAMMLSSQMFISTENPFVNAVSITASAASLSGCKVTLPITSVYYTGSAINPAPIVKYGSSILKKNTHYTVSYKNNKAVGTATVTIKGRGYFSGTVSKSFTIKAINSPTKLTASTGLDYVNLSWGKVSYANGYYVELYKSGKYVRLYSGTGLSYKAKNLSSNTSYKFRITAYRKIGSSTYKTYSTISAKTKQSQISAYQDEILKLVNAERKKEGVSALKLDPILNSVAATRAKQITTQFDHKIGNGSTTLGDMLDKAGFSWHGLGENIAYGYKTPSEVMKAWMNSSGHRKNILNSSYTHLGVGLNGTYAVQVFANH